MPRAILAIEAEIVFLDVGRKLPLTLSHPTARYRPHVRVAKGSRLGVEFRQQAQEVMPGNPARFIFVPLFPGVDYSVLQPDIDFEILEGDLVVGQGRVMSISKA